MTRTITAAVAALLAAAPAGLAASPAAPPAAAAQGAIRSPAVHACLDPSVSPNPYDTLAGAPCSGSAAQTFSFVPIAGGPAHTYEFVDTASGRCIAQFRFGIQAGTCNGSSSAGDAWTLEPVGTSTTAYRIVLASTVGSPGPGTWGVRPRAQGQPGPLFAFGVNPPNETFRLPAGL